VFDHANGSSQLLRRQADDANDFQQRVADSEADFNNRLIEIFGTPYADDIGPLGTYPTGYAGPDIYHYDYADDPEVPAGTTSPQATLRFQLSNVNVNGAGVLNQSVQTVTFQLSPNGLGLVKPSAWVGQRSAPGEIQLARAALLESLRRLERGLSEYENLIDQIEDGAKSLQAEIKLNADIYAIRYGGFTNLVELNTEIRHLRQDAADLRLAAGGARATILYVAEALPKVVGFATDVFSFKAATLRFIGRLAELSAAAGTELLEREAASAQDEKAEVAALTDLKLFSRQASFNQTERLRQVEQLVRVGYGNVDLGEVVIGHD
jgi:hypothetical protein